MRILVSKPDSLGDQLIAGGFIQQLHVAVPQAQIIWHVRSGMEVVGDILEATYVFRPDVHRSPETEMDRLLQLDASHGVILLPVPIHPAADWTGETRQVLDWWKRFLESTAWDYALAPVPNRTWVSDASVCMSGAKETYGYHAGEATPPFTRHVQKELLGINHPVYRHKASPCFRQCEYDQVQKLFQLFADKAGLSIDFDYTIHLKKEIREAAVSHKPARIKVNDTIEEQGNLVLVFAGASGDRRHTWPMEKFLQLGNWLRSRGCRVGWVQGPADARFFEEFPSHVPVTPTDNLTLGAECLSEFLNGEAMEFRLRLTSNQLDMLASLVVASDLVICHDTAYAHLAAACGVPTVALFGIGQEARFHPPAARSDLGLIKIVRGEMACRGCQWHCLFPLRHCLQDIPVASVQQAVEDLLERSDAQLVSVPLKLPGLSVDIVEEPGTASLEASESAFVREQLQRHLVFQEWDKWSYRQMLLEHDERHAGDV